MKNKIKFFNKASIVSCIIISIITIISIVITIFINNPDWKSFFIGFIATLIGLIVSIIAIQAILDNENDKNKKIKETIAIRNSNKLFMLYLENYIYNFNCVVTPLSNAGERLGIVFKEDFKVSDMKDMYLSQGSMFKNFSESCISLFFKSQKEIVDNLKVMLQTISFDFYPELSKIIIEIIQENLKIDVKDYILQFDTYYKGNIKLPKSNAEMIESYNGNPEQDIITNKYHSHILLPYLYLYKTMKKQSQLLDKYREYCKNNKLFY